MKLLEENKLFLAGLVAILIGPTLVAVWLGTRGRAPEEQIADRPIRTVERSAVPAAAPVRATPPVQVEPLAPPKTESASERPITLAQAAPPAQSLEDGQVIFEQKCIACHTIGGGPLAGPDLQGVTARRDRDWLTRWIFEPDKMLAESDPIVAELLQEFNNVPMPNMGLSETDVAAVLAYLDAPGLQPVLAPAVAPSWGDPEAGRQLFTGELKLDNRGTACISCHGVSRVGALGGGTLGPDLTNVFGRYGEAGLAASLKDLPFPTMQGVFADKPLTENEVADLYAYFVQADQKTAQPAGFSFALIGLGGFLALGLLSHLLWRKRLTGVRRPLVGR